MTCKVSILRYNPRHYGEAQNQAPQAVEAEGAPKGAWRKTA